MWFNKIEKSLRLKLILVSITIEIIMLTLLLSNSLRIVNTSIDHQILIKKESITPLLDSALSIPLFQRDSATLIGILEKLKNSAKSEFTYISVYDDQGKIFSETINSNPNIENNIDNKTIHITAPLTLADEKIGQLKYGLSVQSLYHTKTTLLKQGIIIAAFEIALTILLLGLSGYYLTRHVTTLLKGAEEISSGNYDVNIPIDTNDEIGLLAKEFNIMAQSIKNRIIEISETTEALSIKSAEFESIFNAMADGVILVDTNRVCISVNPATLKMFNYPLEKFINKKLDFLYKNINEYEGQNEIRFSKTAPDRTDSFEATYIRSDGSTFSGELLATRVKDKNGKSFGFIGILRDISERKQHEEQIRRTLKMDALGKLTGGIAHDYNNMLGVILGYAELIELTIDEPKAKDYIKEIHQAGQRGVKLTNKLLSFSRQKSSDKELININSVLLDEKDMLEKTLTARITLNFDLNNNIWPFVADKAELVDAIVNLSINAMHAINGNGHLTFSTSNETMYQSDSKPYQSEKHDYVALSIADNGCGMSEDEKEKIFEPFYTTKGELGTGLGLSQVYGFVQRCQGNIKVISKLEHGTKITIYFPRFIEEKRDNNNNKLNDSLVIEDKANSNLSGNETVLIVDDEPALLNLTKKTLSLHGYAVLCANDAFEALEILSKNSIDLIVSDVIMPGMDGYELSAKVQEKYPDIKIQLVSGYNDNRHKKLVNKSIHENLLHKPYHSNELLQKLRELLAK